MKKYASFIILFFALLGCYSQAVAQNLSNRGTDFWVGYGHHQFMESGANSQEMVLYLSAEAQAATVTVSLNGTAWSRTYNVPANSVISTGTAVPIAGTPGAGPFPAATIPKAGTYDARLYTVPCGFLPPGTACGGEGQFNNKGIHIVSNVPIVAYAHIYGSASSGATMLMPVETWGYSYVTLNSKQEYATNCFSWAYVIAQHDNTVVEITPSQTTRFPRAANTPFTVTLNRGQIYQIMAGPETGSAKPEFSGTKFKSIANAAGECYPIAVFAGSSRTRGGPVSCGSPSGGDNDNQQCFPTQSWGKRYLTAPTSNSATASTPMWNTFKIAVKDPATVVRRNGVVLTGLTNSYYEFISNTADYIEADKPVMVAQFIHSGSACFGGGGVGDPEMMYISPIEQGIKRIGFFRNDEENITVNYLTLTIPTAGLASLLIDGSPTFTHTYPHPNLPGYTVVVRRWTGAQAQATASSDSAFTAITYGLGSVESYGYNAGTLINNLNAVGSIFNTSDTSTTVTSHPFTCTNTPVKLSVLLGYQTPPTQIVWQLSTVGGGLAPNADVTDNAPTPVGTQMVNGVMYSKYELPGTYTFTTAGTYRIPILATHPSVENCNNRESLYYDIEVRGKPSTNFAINHTGCLLDTVHFIGETVSANGFNINQWLYTFHDATTSISKDTSKLYAAPGTYNVNLRVVTTEGCVGDTTKEVIIGSAPVSSFSIDDPAVCEGSNISFNSTAAYAGITNYYWDFGDGTIVNTPSPAAQTHAYPTFGTYTVRHSISVGPVCISDTSDQVVTVSAIPTTSFTYPAGCLPATGVVQFTSTAFAADGQPITSHLWTFGDPASGAANTSALANPTHTYPGFGNYTITYQTSTAACSKDTTVNATFNLAPAFSYPALADVCQNSATTINVATATVTNAVPGAGVYNGPGTTAAGIFDPAAAGAGTHTIWYVYTANSGCKDSISQTITVDPTPEANFTIAGAGCLPPTGTVTFTYSGTAQTGQTYAWDFGDPASGVNNTSALQNPTHNYTTGNYTITLTVTNPATGCVVTETVTQTFNVTPALNYPALAPTCENLTNVNIATATVTNGVTGTGVYSGPGTTAAGIFDPSVAGAGTHTITYTFTGTGNCVATTTQTILVNAKPNASFTYPTAACLPASGIANFTYNGSMSAGQTYVWNFGDPASGANNTSTAQNPSHTYTNTGTYSVSVTVTNANGCIDDSVINNIVFSVTPALSFPALTAVCSNDASFSVANATVTNGVSGTGVYSGPGTDAAGNFDPAAAGPGTHTITYTFTSSANCVASIARTILVNAAPSATFTASTTACLPANGNVVFTYTGTAQPGQTYAWNFGDPASGANNTSAIANPSHNFAEGNYMIILTVTNPATGCIDKDTLVQTFALTPALAYPALTATCENLTNVNVATATVTNGVAGTGVYSGPGTSSAGIFNPTIAGAGTHTITYTFTSSANCVASITQTIVVNAKPNASFTYPTAACLPATGIANFTYNGSMSAGQTYLWNFGDPASGANNTSTAQNPSHTYTNTGSYSVSVTVTNANGCIDDSVINNIVFSVTPALNYPVLAAVCENLTSVNVATATVTNGVTGTGVYSGPGTSAAGIFDPSVAGPGTHIITYTFTSTGNCVSSITQNIVVNARPAASFTYPTAACLPATGIANFTYNGSMSAGQTYLWNFGDPASGANNISTAQNPSHTYTNTGSYSVSVTVTNANGCIDDSVINNIVFSVTPALNYPALTAVCENLTSVNVATATVTNGVTGTGVYSGPGTSAAGIFDPSVAGAGTFTIMYTFTSTGNCVSTITQNIVVNPKPVSAFTITPDICLGQQANITSNATIPTGTITTWKWFFGDGNTATYTNGNAFSYLYTAFGSYTVKLVTVSADGCESDTAMQTITVGTVPVASFTMPASVCMPDGVTFTNNSTVSDGSTLTYAWNFGDPASGVNNTSTATSPTHVYATAGSYTISLRATGGNGCFKDTVQVFDQFFNKPIAAFSVNPTELCQGTDNVFTDLSTAPNSTISSRLWIFGDGTTSTATNPTKRYTNPGIYQVKLVVTNAQGCVSDTFPQSITVHLQPVIDAGPSFVVAQGSVIQFAATANDNSGATAYLWTPSAGLSAPASLTPQLTAIADQTYTLTATGSGNCTATDFITVKILKPLKIPNAFSPNGDGVNDTWIIENLSDYPGAIVEIYNRYGQIVMKSTGYSRPWDGTTNGKPLPLATYYYIIQLKNGFKPLNGSITIIK
jgi:gliding motility-associated-like protein